MLRHFLLSASITGPLDYSGVSDHASYCPRQNSPCGLLTNQKCPTTNLCFNWCPNIWKERGFGRREIGPYGVQGAFRGKWSFSRFPLRKI